MNSEGSSIDLEEFKQSLNIYPNPTSGILFVSQENEYLTQIKVYTILGKEVYSNNLLNSLKIDLSSKSNGVYFIEFSNGKEKITERLILNR